MIGVDTNILVRYLTQDDRAQSARATVILEHTLTEDEPGFVSLVTMVETVWVLDRAYRLADSAIAAVVERMLQADTLVIQNEQDVFTAMVALRAGTAAFADALIGALGRRAGCSATLTFDRKPARLVDFRLA